MAGGGAGSPAHQPTGELAFVGRRRLVGSGSAVPAPVGAAQRKVSICNLRHASTVTSNAVLPADRRVYLVRWLLGVPKQTEMRYTCGTTSGENSAQPILERRSWTRQNGALVRRLEVP